MKAIDLFAGWGGFTLAAEMADVDVVWAANHWPLAVEAHALNHPKTEHVCQDLRQANWARLPRYDLMLASPSCQGHSEASQPKRAVDPRFHDAMRATAWAVVDCADVTTPKALIVENVPEFREWRLYSKWRECLETIGYHLTEHVLTASHHGVPQRRRRLFIIGTRRVAKLTLPTPTPEPAFGPCINWNEGIWKPVALAPHAVQERIARGRKRLGRRFITQHVTGHPGIPLDEPIRTITTKDQFAAVDGDHYRPLTVRETARGMSFPENYTWPAHASRRDMITGLGNAVCPLQGRDVIEMVKEAA